jgi:nitrous oxidase accessory protein NosD
MTRNLLMSVWDYSLKLVNAKSSDVRTNTVIHSNHGVVVQYSTGTDVVSNIFGPYIGTGIFVTSSDATLVQSNRMNDTTVGIFLSEAQGATVTANIVQRTHTGIIVNYSGSFLFGGVPNSVKSNEVNEAVFGMRTAQPGTDTLTPNTFTNVATTTAPY